MWLWTYKHEQRQVMSGRTSQPHPNMSKLQVTFCVWTQISATYKHEQHEPQVTFCVWTQISATTKHKHTAYTIFLSIDQECHLRNPHNISQCTGALLLQGHMTNTQRRGTFTSVGNPALQRCL